MNSMLVLTIMILGGCGHAKNEVVIYSSLDQVFSEPILQQFERETGIKVRAVYDVEATKTTGLVNRLIAEKGNPQADVFWNSEIARTLVLKKEGVLASYFSPQAKDIPDQFKDKEGYWTGFSARCRVLIYNKNLLSDEALPRSIFDLTAPQWKGKLSLAYPLFGTTATHAAALFVALGDEKAEAFYRALKENQTIIVDGNSTSRDLVQDGKLPIGFTDTDDAAVSLANNKPVGIVYLDQGEGQMGTLLIPNTVALIKNSRNPENGKRLMDYLLSKDVESRLAFADCAQIPLRESVKRPSHVRSYQEIKTMPVDFEKVADKIADSGKVLQNIFVR